MKETPDLETRIAGIPCGIVVDSFFEQPQHKGSPLTCNSDWDFYGYVDVEWHVVDRRGYLAAWLQSKMTQDDADRIKKKLLKQRKGQ